MRISNTTRRKHVRRLARAWFVHSGATRATPAVLQMPFGELNYAQSAALTPDLIVATHAGITEEEYATLAQSAPTVYLDAYADLDQTMACYGELLGRKAEVIISLRKAPSMFRRVTLLLTLLALLAACGGQPAAVQPTSAPAPTAVPAPTNAPASTDAPAVPTPLPATPAPAAAVGDCPEGQRLFDHELLAGEPVCIPSDPQRIIALDMASVELTLLADKTLLATSGWILSELPLLHPPFAEALATVEDVGYPANLEQVALLKPDLILAVGDTSAGASIDAEQARQIAPLVFADPVIYNDWKLGMRLWADVLNVPDVYEAMEANYQARAGELRTALGDTRDREISVLSTSTYGISLWMPDTPPGAILSDVGLARPESQRFTGEAAVAEYTMAQYVTISTERLDLADGDAIFYFTYASSDPEVAGQERDSMAAFEQQPVWQSLDAVQAGQAFRVPEYWWRSQTYLLANKVLDDLFTHLTDTSATTPVLNGQP